MKKIIHVMRMSILVNVMLAIGKILAGWLGSSGALIADGIHSFSDLVTDFCAILGSKMAAKPADKEHPYGHGRLEYMTSLVIGVMILGVGFSVIYGAFSREITIPSVFVILVSFISIVAKLGLSIYLIRKGNEYHSNILTASGKESRTDVVSSFVVLLSSSCMQFTNEIPILKYADLVAMIVVGILIVHVGFGVLKENLSAVLGEREMDREVQNEIEALAQSYEEIYHIESINLIKYGPYYCLDLVIHMDGGLTLICAHKIVDQLENQIQKKYPNIQYLNIHMEPEEK